MTTSHKPNMPSIKTLEQAFPDNAREARAVLKMNRDQLEAHPVGAARVKECYHAPMTWDLRMSITLGDFIETQERQGKRFK